jgi:hypothetical protein
MLALAKQTQLGRSRPGELVPPTAPIVQRGEVVGLRRLVGPPDQPLPDNPLTRRVAQLAAVGQGPSEAELIAQAIESATDPTTKQVLPGFSPITGKLGFKESYIEDAITKGRGNTPRSYDPRSEALNEGVDTGVIQRALEETLPESIADYARRGAPGSLPGGMSISRIGAPVGYGAIDPATPEGRTLMHAAQSALPAPPLTRHQQQRLASGRGNVLVHPASEDYVGMRGSLIKDLDALDETESFANVFLPWQRVRDAKTITPRLMWTYLGHPQRPAAPRALAAEELAHGITADAPPLAQDVREGAVRIAEGLRATNQRALTRQEIDWRNSRRLALTSEALNPKITLDGVVVAPAIESLGRGYYERLVRSLAPQLSRINALWTRVIKETPELADEYREIYRKLRDQVEPEEFIRIADAALASPNPVAALRDDILPLVSNMTRPAPPTRAAAESTNWQREAVESGYLQLPEIVETRRVLDTDLPNYTTADPTIGESPILTEHYKPRDPGDAPVRPVYPGETSLEPLPLADEAAVRARVSRAAPLPDTDPRDAEYRHERDLPDVVRSGVSWRGPLPRAIHTPGDVVRTADGQVGVVVSITGPEVTARTLDPTPTSQIGGYFDQGFSVDYRKTQPWKRDAAGNVLTDDYGNPLYDRPPENMVRIATKDGVIQRPQGQVAAVGAGQRRQPVWTPELAETLTYGEPEVIGSARGTPPPVGSMVTRGGERVAVPPAHPVAFTPITERMRRGALVQSGKTGPAAPALPPEQSAEFDIQRLLREVLSSERQFTANRAAGVAAPGGAAKTGNWLRYLNHPKLLAAALAGGGAALAGEEEAEAAPLPRLPGASPALGEILSKQTTRAARVEPSQPLSTRLAERLTDSRALLEKVLLAIGPAVRARFGAAVNNGIGIANDLTGRTKDLYNEARGRGLEQAVRANLNLTAYSREINTVEAKIRAAHDRAARFDEMGRDADAARARASVADMVRKRDAKALTPLQGKDAAALQAERNAILGALPPDDRALVERTTTALHQVTRDVLDLLHTEGAIDDTLYNAFRMRGPDYIPLPRIFDAFDDARQEWVKTRFMRGGETPNRTRLIMADVDLPELEEIRGSALLNADPFVAIARFVNAAVDDVQRIRAGRAFLEPAAAHSKQIANIAVVRKLGAPLTGSALDRAKAAGLDQVAVPVAGKPSYYLVDRDVANALGSVDTTAARGMFATMSTARRFFHAAAATANIAFIATQVAKDPASGMINPSYSRYRKGGLAKDFATTYWPELIKTAFGGLIAGKVERMFGVDVLGSAKRFREVKAALEREGAIGRPLGGYFDAESEILGRQWSPRWRDRIPEAGVRAVGAIQDALLEPVEVAVKRAANATLRKRGFGADEAAFETKRFAGSPDFNRLGTAITPKTRDLWMFINPTIQGIDRLRVKVAEEPGRMAKWAGLLTGGLLAVDAFNSTQVDSDGNPELDKYTRAERANNLIILNPAGEREQLSNGDTRMAALLIPLSHEIVALTAPFRSFFQAAKGDPGYGFPQAVLDTVSPWIPGGARLEAGSLADSAARRVIGAMNPLARLPVEQLWGQSGRVMQTGAPIVGSRVAGRLPQYQFTARTEPGARALGKLTGLSPDRLQHLITGLAPGIGEQALSAAQLALPRGATVTGVEGRTEALTRAPVIGSLLRRFISAGTQNQPRMDRISRLYEALAQTRQAATTPRSVAARNRAEFATIDLQALRGARAANNPLEDAAGHLTRIDAQRERLQTDPTLNMTATARRAALKELWNAESALLQRTDAIIADLKSKGVIR